MKNINEIPEIEVFLGSNLNCSTRVFTWGLANDHDICKKYEKPAKHILSNLISNTKNLKKYNIKSVRAGR